MTSHHQEAPFPEYYILLQVQQSANTEEIRQAYKRESLKTHPDRLGKASAQERKVATEKFQAVADAYYVLSDPVRRKEYDVLLASRSRSSRTADPGASPSFFNSFFTGTGTSTERGPRPDANGVFGDVFEEMMRPEIEKRVPWWTYIGAIGGALLGYIIANIPGAMAGAFAGNRLGAIRDAKGKPVAHVFAQLGGAQKAEILRALALKVLGTTMPQR